MFELLLPYDLLLQSVIRPNSLRTFLNRLYIFWWSLPGWINHLFLWCQAHSCLHLFTSTVYLCWSGSSCGYSVLSYGCICVSICWNYNLPCFCELSQSWNKNIIFLSAAILFILVILICLKAASPATDWYFKSWKVNKRKS